MTDSRKTFHDVEIEDIDEEDEEEEEEEEEAAGNNLNWNWGSSNDRPEAEPVKISVVGSKSAEDMRRMVAAKVTTKRLEDTRWDPSLDAVDSYHPIVHQSNCFDDGKRQIDYVLAYKPYGGKPDNEWTAKEIEELKTQNFGPANCVHKRVMFVSELIAEGLEIEYTHPDDSWDEQLLFIKVHVPWERMLLLAEMNHIKMPFKRRKRPRRNKVFSWFKRKHRYDLQMFPRRGFFVEIPFLRSKIKQFIGADDPTTFFRPDQRITLCYSVLSTAAFDDSHDQGVDAMVGGGILLAAYPIHDGDWDRYTKGCCSTKRKRMTSEGVAVEDGLDKGLENMQSETSAEWSNDNRHVVDIKDNDNGNDNMHVVDNKVNDKGNVNAANGTKKVENKKVESRRVESHHLSPPKDQIADKLKRSSDGFYRGSLRHRLYEGWACVNHACIVQPKDYVRCYFGDTVGLYYEWIGFWIEVTIPMAIIGVLASLTMIYFPIKEFFSEITPWCSRSDMAMCPQCDEICRYWVPTDLGCLMAYVNAYVDNPVPVVVSGSYRLRVGLLLQTYVGEERAQYSLRVEFA